MGVIFFLVIEEIGVPVKVMSSLKTYYLPHKKSETIKEIKINDNPQPFALYEMIYPEETSHQGEIYYILIYKAELINKPKYFKEDEVKAIIGLTEEQIRKSLQRRPTIQKPVIINIHVFQNWKPMISSKKQER